MTAHYRGQSAALRRHIRNRRSKDGPRCANPNCRSLLPSHRVAEGKLYCIDCERNIRGGQR